MQHFKDQDGVVFAYDDDVSLDVINALRPGLVQMTDEEVIAHMKQQEPPITAKGLKEIVTAFRWEVETGGITLDGGMRVATGEDDQKKNSQALSDAKLAGFESINFSTLGVWYTLTIAQLEAVVVAVARYRQKCRDAERAHHEAIDALLAQHQDDSEALQAALDGYDESQCWPSVNLSQAEA